MLTASNVITLHDVPRQVIWEIIRDDNNDRIAYYLHPDHHYKQRLGKHLPPYNHQANQTICNGVPPRASLDVAERRRSREAPARR